MLTKLPVPAFQRDTQDYRYFPDPRLPGDHSDAPGFRDKRLPARSLRAEKDGRYQEKEYSLSAYGLDIILESQRNTWRYFSAHLTHCAEKARKRLDQLADGRRTMGLLRKRARNQRP